MTRPLALGSVLVVALLACLTGGCSTLPPQNGPIVGIRNDSDAPLRVRFWIGDRRQQAAGTPLQLTADKVLEVAPYGTTQYRLGAFSAYESSTESFVRVQVEPVGPTFQASTQYWYEFTPPSPFTVRVHGRQPDLKFDRAGPGTMVFVPPAYWFHATPAPVASTRTTTTTATSGTTTVTTATTPAPKGGTTTTATPVVSVPEAGTSPNH